MRFKCGFIPSSAYQYFSYAAAVQDGGSCWILIELNILVPASAAREKLFSCAEFIFSDY
jgi:hypothetical protein